MGAFLKTPFGEIAPYLADYGYTPVPIRPGGKAPLIDDWQAGHPVVYYLPRCATWGTGILTRTCPAIDLDIRNKDLVGVLISLAEEMIGPCPFRVGAPPKALLPFSAAEPFDKISGRWWAMPGDDWSNPDYSPHRIEVLGDGQQFVAYARHPRGTYYRWARGEPMDTCLVDLPEIDHDTASTFLEVAEQVIAEVGAVPLRRQAGTWRPDLAQSAEHPTPRHHRNGDFVAAWRLLDAEYVARAIDPKGAHRTKDGWSCKCPVHKGIGNTSLGITAGTNGELVCNCFAGCDWREVGNEISRILGAAP